MEFIAGIIGFITWLGFVMLCNTVNKMKKDQAQANRLLAEQNNQLSELINLIKDRMNAS